MKLFKNKLAIISQKFEFDLDNILKLLYISGCFHPENLRRHMAIALIDEHIIANIIDQLNQANSYQDEESTDLDAVDWDIVKMSLNTITDIQKLIDWFIIATQYRFFNRRTDKGQERWDVPPAQWISNASDDIQNILQLTDFFAEKAFHYRPEYYSAFVVHGASLGVIEKRLCYLVTYLEKYSYCGSKPIFITAGSRKANGKIDAAFSALKRAYDEKGIRIVRELLNYGIINDTEEDVTDSMLAALALEYLKIEMLRHGMDVYDIPASELTETHLALLACYRLNRPELMQYMYVLDATPAPGNARTTTDDTMKHLREGHSNKLTHVALVSHQPYIAAQHSQAKMHLAGNIETVGGGCSLPDNNKNLIKLFQRTVGQLAGTWYGQYPAVMADLLNLPIETCRARRDERLSYNILAQQKARETIAGYERQGHFPVSATVKQPQKAAEIGPPSTTTQVMGNS